MCKPSGSNTQHQQSKVTTHPADSNTLLEKKLLFHHLDRIYKANKGIRHINDLMRRGIRGEFSQEYSEALGDPDTQEGLIEVIFILSEAISENESELYDIVRKYEEVVS